MWGEGVGFCYELERRYLLLSIASILSTSAGHASFGLGQMYVQNVEELFGNSIFDVIVLLPTASLGLVVPRFKPLGIGGCDHGNGGLSRVALGVFWVLGTFVADKDNRGRCLERLLNVFACVVLVLGLVMVPVLEMPHILSRYLELFIRPIQCNKQVINSFWL